MIVCPLTSNLERAVDAGNVLLELGEANLSKRSVVNVSQFYTLDKARLAEYIGTLSTVRVQQIISGIAETFAFVEPAPSAEKPESDGFDAH